MIDAEISAGAVLTIDLDALVANYRFVEAQVAPALVAAVVKADAYGLGAARVSSALAEAGCAHFFVAHLGEAVALRRHIDAAASVYVLNGLQPGAEPACAEIDVIPVINSLDQIARWSREGVRRGMRLPAVLQIDTGMSRLGLPAYQVDALCDRSGRLDGLELRLVMSHLACADDVDAAANEVQLESFRALTERFPGVPLSLDNSGGAFLSRVEHFDLVRAGIALYGGAPQMGAGNPMRPVVALDARIVQVRDIPAGTGVGYGLHFQAKASARIATISVGYADGWPRHLSGCGSAYVGGIRVPVAGRVSMDSITLDVTGVPAALLAPGAPVELLGPHQTIDDVAGDAGTISYEILTRLGHRYARRYLPRDGKRARRSANA